MKYNVNYMKALSALNVYAKEKKNINAIYRIHNPGCKQYEYAEYVYKNGLPDNIPKTTAIKENFTICRNAEAFIQSVLNENKEKHIIWNFILNEEFVADRYTIQKKLSILQSKNVNISRATYYREIVAFVNAFAEALGLGDEYCSEKKGELSSKTGRSLLI